MNLGTAHATLGVDADTPIDEVRQRYRMRAQMLHPDRLGERSDLQAEAQRAMSELNEAWDVVSTAEKDGSRRLTSSDAGNGGPFEDRRRLPVAGECDLCGAAPAREVKYRALTGLVLLWRSRTMHCEMCRNCGKSMFREVQSDTLVKGWWGIVAVYANFVVVLMNLWTVLRHQRGLPPQSRRDPNVVTPLPPGLPLSKPLLRRPAPIVASAVAATIMAMLFTTSGSSGSPSGPVGPSNRSTGGPAGTCLDANGTAADCSGPLAKFRLTKQVMSASECSPTETVFQNAAGHIYCAESMP